MNTQTLIQNDQYYNNSLNAGNTQTLIHNDQYMEMELLLWSMINEKQLFQNLSGKKFAI